MRMTLVVLGVLGILGVVGYAMTVAAFWTREHRRTYFDRSL